MANKLNTKPFYNTTVPGDWDTPELGTVFKFLKSYSFSRAQLSNEKTNNEILNIHYGDIHSTYKNGILDFEIEQNVPYLNDGLLNNNDFVNDNSPALQDGDLIIADASEDYNGVCNCVELKNINSRRVVSGLHTFAARSNEKIISLGFRTYVLKHGQVVRALRRIATGISVYGVSKTNLSKIKISLPPLPEQKAIAQVLSTWDKAINLNNQLIVQKELRKKWLMLNVLPSSRRINNGIKSERYQRTKIGVLPCDWKLLSLKDILNSKGKSLSPEKNEPYQQIGIRSHTKGIFYKDKVTGASLGNKRVFWIEPDCFIVNIVFAWEHAIAKTTKNEIGMIASHRFPMYKPKTDILNLDYLLFFFKSPRGKHLLGLASPGGAGRNKTLGKSAFMKLKIPVPLIIEQKRIAQILTSADKELTLLKNKTVKLKEQKKGLMQLLLTGKKRLKID